MTTDADTGLDREAGPSPKLPEKRVAPEWRVQTLPEERANALTHGVGFVLAAVGLMVLVFKASTYGGIPHIVGCSIFGATLVTTYLTSTVYHSVQAPQLKHRLRILDHITIYLLIAGTYTPFMLVSLGAGLGWTFFGIVWAIACAGTIYKIVAFGKFKRLSLASYLGMGWLAVFVVQPLWNELSANALLLMGAGGLSYTFGVIFYVMHQKRYFHAVWHLFVMGGSACHYAAILLYVVPPTPVV